MSRSAIAITATPSRVQTTSTSGSYSNDLRELSADVRPGVHPHRLLARSLAAPAPLVLVGDRGDDRSGEGVDVVGLDQPPGLRIVDDRRRPAAPDRDHRQPAGHRLDQDLAELLTHGGVDEEVAGSEEGRKLLVPLPAGEEDVAGAGPGDRLAGMLALPLAGMAADEDERDGLLELRLGAGEGLDQQRQPLDL